MRTDTLFAQLMTNSFPYLLEMAGIYGVKQSDYNVQSVELKDLNRRMDGVAEPLVDGLPVVAIEFYAQKEKNAYRNIVHKMFRYLEDRNSLDPFVILLIFADRACDPTDQMVEHWIPTPSFIRIHLDEWLTNQPKNSYYDCLRMMVEPENEKLDAERVLNAIHEATEQHSFQILNIILNAFYKKYPVSNLDFNDMMNIHEPFDYTQTQLYKTFCARMEPVLTQKITQDLLPKLTKDLRTSVTNEVTEKVTNEVTEKVTNEVTEKVTQVAREQSKIEFAQSLIASGMDDAFIQKHTKLSLEQIKALRNNP